jgi:hypothetical protein
MNRRAHQPSQENLCLQRAILALVLNEHPAELTHLELVDRLFGGPEAADAGAPLAYAIRDLAIGGLLKSRGPLVLPTPAGLHIKRLDLCQWPIAGS